jgi:hypothetical protein
LPNVSDELNKGFPHFLQVSIYSTKEKIVNVETFCRLSKDDVRRSAAKLNRDEKTQSRVLETSDSRNITTQPFVANGVESQTPTLRHTVPFQTSQPAKPVK